MLDKRKGNTKSIIDERNEKGFTPLMLAARNNHLPMVQHLLENGVDATLVNKIGQSAGEIANFWGNKSVAETISSHLKPKLASQLEHVNYFSHSIVNRSSYKRSDQAFIDSEMRSPKARFLIFGKLQLFMRQLEDKVFKETIYLKWDDVKDKLEDEDYDVVFLGIGNLENGVLMREGVACPEEHKHVYYAINYKKTLESDFFPIQDGFFGDRGFQGMMGLRNEDAGIAAQARSVLAWHDNYNFCPACGSKTNMAEAGWKRVCTNNSCRTHKGTHNVCYPRTDPVVIILILSPDKQKCMLGRQGRHLPRMYSAVAGFLESGESIEDAARREAMEEVGVKVGKIEYISSQPWPFPSSLMIGLMGHALSEDFECDHVELDDARWFPKSEVAAAYVEGFNKKEGLLIPPAYAIANQLVGHWLKMQQSTL